MKLLSVLILAGGLVLAAPARAADDEGCTGFVTAVPAVVAKAGVWCLSGDLSTAMASGTAITVTTSNVTIDCNGHTLGGPLAAGTTSTGIAVAARINTTVTGCHVRGFRTGVSLVGFGHRVLDSRIERSTTGVHIDSTPGLVRGNRITDMGAADLTTGARAINAIGDVDILDNDIDRVRGANANGRVVGVMSRDGQSNVIARNRIVSVENTLAGGTSALVAGSGNPDSRSVVHDNDLIAFAPGAAGIGLYCGSPTVLTRGNQVVGWTTAIAPGCASVDDSGSP